MCQRSTLNRGSITGPQFAPMAAMPTPEENRVRNGGQEHYRSVTELMNAFEQNYLIDLAEGTAAAGQNNSAEDRIV